MSAKLGLVQIPDKIKAVRPIAVYAAEAAKLIKVDIKTFREYVKSGIIPARSHPGRVRELFLISDLRAYLKSLPPKNVKNKPKGDIVPFGRGRRTSNEGGEEWQK
jgi:hypothetical protein